VEWTTAILSPAATGLHADAARRRAPRRKRRAWGELVDIVCIWLDLLLELGGRFFYTSTDLLGNSTTM
jgi:hypothetical protein